MHGIFSAIGVWFLYELVGEMIGELLFGILEATFRALFSRAHR